MKKQEYKGHKEQLRLFPTRDMTLGPQMQQQLPLQHQGVLPIASMPQTDNKYQSTLKLKVTINKEEWETLQLLTDLYYQEFSVYGVVTQIRLRDKEHPLNHRIHIEKLLPLPKQKNTYANTLVTARELEEMIAKANLSEDEKKRVNFWMHSHHSMGAFWSSTDDSNAQGLSIATDYLVSIVMNKRGEFLIRYDSFYPNQFTLFHDQIDFKILDNSPLAELDAAYKARLEELNKEYATKKEKLIEENKSRILARIPELSRQLVEACGERVDPSFNDHTKSTQTSGGISKTKKPNIRYPSTKSLATVCKGPLRKFLMGIKEGMTFIPIEENFFLFKGDPAFEEERNSKFLDTFSGLPSYDLFEREVNSYVSAVLDSETPLFTTIEYVVLSHLLEYPLDEWLEEVLSPTELQHIEACYEMEIQEAVRTNTYNHSKWGDPIFYGCPETWFESSDSKYQEPTQEEILKHLEEFPPC